MNPIANSRYYDPKNLRLNYPAGFLEVMPVETITERELLELMKTMEFNPPYYYSDKVQLHPNEVGHDDKCRYVTEEQT